MKKYSNTEEAINDGFKFRFVTLETKLQPFAIFQSVREI